MNKLLIDDHPLQFLPKLAEEIGVNEAIMVQQIHYWLMGKSAKKRDGKFWIYNTYDSWQEQFPFWSVSTIRRTVSSLQKQELIFIANYNKLGFDKTKWYSINYDKIEQVNRRCVQNEQRKCSEWADGSVQNEQPNNQRLPETSTKTSNTKSSKHDAIPYEEIVNYLNGKADTKFKHTTKKTRESINARFNEGFTLDDFKTVIDKKVKDWKGVTFKDGRLGDNYLRPTTLFRTNFEGYLNEKNNNQPERTKQQSTKDWRALRK